jgi:DNA-binding PadR family transcriptional regulator
MDARTLCLGVLSLGEATGYEIKRTLEQVFGHFYNASFGSIYPALARLTEDGEVISLDAATERFPDRRRYRLTESGRAQLRAALAAAKGHEVVRSEFLVALFFAELLPINDLHRLVDERLAESRQIVSSLSSYGRTRMSDGQRFTIRYGLAVARAAIDFLEGEGRAIAQAIARERQAALGAENYLPGGVGEGE